jgi:hypothetical protein
MNSPELLTIRKAHAPSFTEFPKVEAGEWVTFVRSDAKHPHWFFGRDPRGIEGYFPKALFTGQADQLLRASASYDATEIAVAREEHVLLKEACGDWLRVTGSQGTGWIPRNCCYPEEA